MNDCFSLHMFDASSPLYPVILGADQEPDEHTGIHFSDVDSTQSSGVAGIHFFVCVLIWIFVIGEGLSGVMGVEIKKKRALGSSKIMCGGGPAAFGMVRCSHNYQGNIVNLD